MKKFADYILALLFGAAAVCAALEAYDFGDSDADIAHSIMAERARAYGDESGAAAQRAKIKNPRFIAEDGARFADLKIKILRGEFDKGAVSEQIEDAAQGGGKALLYALAAAAALRDGAKEADGFLFAARCALLDADVRLSEQHMLEASAALSRAESKAAQELALDIAMKLQYSYDKALLMCGLVSKKYARERLDNLLKADRKKYAHYLQFINIGNLVSAKDLPDAQLEKRLKYFANQFGISWRIVKAQDYKLPMMAYVFKMRGERERYALYREKSLSKEQLENMKAGYFPYVEYAAKVFCMAGDFDAAIDLLKALPEGHKKNLVLKRLVRYLTMSREGYEKTAAAGAL